MMRTCYKPSSRRQSSGRAVIGHFVLRVMRAACWGCWSLTGPLSGETRQVKGILATQVLLGALVLRVMRAARWAWQVVGGNTVSGRTCATALPCAERQGLLWVCPTPGAALSPDAIAGAPAASPACRALYGKGSLKDRWASCASVCMCGTPGAVSDSCLRWSFHRGHFPYVPLGCQDRKGWQRSTKIWGKDRAKGGARARRAVLPEMDQPGWTSDDFVRDMPVDFTLLLENLADPDHGVFAHQTASFDSFTASPDHPMAVSAAPGPGGDKARPATGPRPLRTRWSCPPRQGPAATRRAPRRARPTV